MLIVMRDFKGWLDGDIGSRPKGYWVPGSAGGDCVRGGRGGEINWGNPLGGSSVSVEIWGIPVLNGVFLEGGAWEGGEVGVQVGGN